MNSKHGILLTTENFKNDRPKNKNNTGKGIKTFLMFMMILMVSCTVVDGTVCSAKESTKVSVEAKASRKKAAKKTTKKSKKNSRKKAAGKKARKKKSPKAEKYTVYGTPAKNAFKSYMSYRAVSSSSAQGKLQAKAKTDSETGIRKVDGRYCIALGSYYCSKIGTKIDLVMANGNIVKCILADQKANCDTDAKNQKTPDGSIAEFLVDMDKLPSKVKTMGDVSYAASELKGSISKIRVYE